MEVNELKTFTCVFFSSGVAGVAATVVTNPIDVVKTRLQLQGELRAHNQHVVRYRNMFHALYVVARTDGVLALQKGLTPALLLGFSMNAIRLGLYHVVDARGWTKNTSGTMSIYKTSFWSGATGYVSGIVANPASLIKTRMQASSHSSIAVGRQHVYKGTLDAIITIYKIEGPRAFFAGTSVVCTRLAAGATAQMPIFAGTKELLVKYNICKNSPFGLALAGSVISGIAVSFIICPFDVICVRLYNQGAATKDGFLYNGVFDCFRKVYTTEGIRGLFKGLGPVCVRIGPYTTVCLIIWDLLNQKFLDKR